jgi:Rps23 Pro-64 3,4-dihydroxylase Tpa1-like proline 4-hydroxylase
MEKIKIYENFLELDFIKILKTKIRSELTNSVWKSSISWGEGVRKSSAPVLIYFLDKDKYIYDYFRNKYDNKFPELKNTEIKIMYYIWPRLSFIPFHADFGHVFASTIYLNEDWHEDYGGLFLYKEKNEIKAIVPKFNLALTNSENTIHGTSLTTTDAPFRETIQIFFNKINK